MRHFFYSSVFGLLFYLLPAVLPNLLAQGSSIDYKRANSLATRTQDTVFRSSIRPHWMPNGSNFWYEVSTGPNTSAFFQINAVTGTRQPLFNVTQLADLLSAHLGAPVSPLSLQLQGVSLESTPSGDILFFQAEGTSWTCSLPSMVLKADSRPIPILNPANPSQIPQRSRRTSDETSLTFVNQTPDDVELYWLDEQGNRQLYGRLRPGAERRQHTFGGHVWIATDRSGSTVGVYVAQAESARAVFSSASLKNFPKHSPPIDSVRLSSESPIGNWRAFITNHNLAIQPKLGGKIRTLSRDGSSLHPFNDEIIWSPDSSHLLARKVLGVAPHIVSWIEASPPGQLQSALRSQSYFKPGDTLPKPSLHLFNLATDDRVDISDTLFPTPFTEDGHLPVKWAANSEEIHLNYNQRGHQIYRILAVNRQGQVRTIIEEAPKTFVDWTAKTWQHWLDSSGELLWMSERDGWCHLWLIDTLSGKVKNQITKGSWVVRSVEHVDPVQRQIWFFAGGIRPEQDPYFLHLCRVDFDGSHLIVLTEADGSHKIDFSPDRRWFLDTWSRVDHPPVIELREAETGHRICAVEA